MKLFVFLFLLLLLNHCTREIISNGVSSDSELRLISSSELTHLNPELRKEYRCFAIQSESEFKEIVSDPNNKYFSNSNEEELKTQNFSDFDWVLFVYTPIETNQSPEFESFQATLQDESDLGKYVFQYDFIQIAIIEGGSGYGRKQLNIKYLRDESYPVLPKEAYSNLRGRYDFQNRITEIKPTFRYLFYFPKSGSKNGIFRIIKNKAETFEFEKK
jgi:hypothetical protein